MNVNYNLIICSISFLNLNAKSFREIRQEFSKFGEIVRQTTGGGTNTDELVTISYNDKGAAVRALQTHFTNKDYPYLDIAKGSSLLLVNSSDSSDCEDHESSILAAVRAGALHPHHQDLLQQSSGQAHHMGGPGGHQLQHDPFSRAHAGPPGSDVVDELLKPLQSYFSVFRTGQYGAGMEHDLVNGGPPAHNTRSQADKRYKIKKQQENDSRSKKRGNERNEIVENGHHLHPSHMAMVMGGPPPMTNGFGPRLDMEADMGHDMSQPPPNMVPGYPPPPHLQHPLLLPPPVLLSSSSPGPNSPSAPMTGYNSNTSAPPPPAPTSGDQSEGQTPLDLDISKMSISDPPPVDDVQSTESPEPEPEQPPVDIEALADKLTKDLFNFYSLSFICKSKDLSERRIRLDFGLVAEVREVKKSRNIIDYFDLQVSRIRGQLGKVDSPVIVSFESKEDCLKCVQDQNLSSKVKA